jgi:hypothetical protein
LSREHHAFIGGDSRGHNYIVALALPQLHWSQFGSIVGFHYINERPLLTDLCGFGGNEHRCLFCIENELYVYELAGPKVMIKVVYRCPQINCPTAVLHRVVEELDAA